MILTSTESWRRASGATLRRCAEITALQTKTESARASLIEQAAAESTAKTKTAAMREAVEAMLKAGSDVILKIRAKAATDGVGIYQLANIPAPAVPSAKGAPGEATNFKVKLENNGALSIGWKCANPPGTSGTSYMVWRRIGTEQLAFLGVTGEKKFVDATVPAGTVMATYQIQAFRSTMAGPWAQFNVNFTTEIGGAMSAAVAPDSPKMAA
ncbi:MAG TPA: hypothetical protein VGR35_05860 [Tepidisphaeraceae bacterium]|nr:hypothetical protein [Tepidisphaeraceae bacterium]